ncbi:extracellular solute-binding protein [Paenibacillus sp. LMG 31460]|uniref:Extracellular solute-binding protein n=1 Tax=Paenibacillus germinis TaxID=2654979 RepID=A0ABX1ZAK2_9BACL|nr:extracellular solute-binding protein [Paenibacillus germinis]NOU90132.1 extracellular solute-binding protein [Paenibacillus germinis]
MIKRKKVAGAVLSSVMVATLVAGCSSSGTDSGDASKSTNSGKKTTAPDYLNAAGMPIVNKPVTLKMFAMAGPYNKGEFKDVEIWKVYEQMTGVHIEWDVVQQANVTEKKNLLLNTGTLPDALFKVGFTGAELTKYGGQGMFLPLNDLIDKYAPNFKKLLDENPDVKKGVTMPDGKIYSLPYLITATPSRLSNKIFVNQKWLSNLNLKEPTTIDELYTVLKAFKEKDPNKNGKNDEIPLSSGQQILSITEGLKGAYGLGTRGAHHQMVDVDPATNKLRFIQTDDRFKELLQFINKLYAEKLLDQEIFTMTLPNIAAKGAQDQIGVNITANNSYVGKEHENDFVGLSAALKGPKGDQLYASLNSSLSAVGTFTITKENKYPEATMRWVDYFYGEEGQKLYFMGIDGKTYTTGSDGKIKYMDVVTNNPAGQTKEEVLGKYVVWSGGSNPSVAGDKYFGDHAIGEITKKAGLNLMLFTPKKLWPQFVFATEDSERIRILENDLITYMKDMQAKFIYGKVGFDKWDEYVSTIKKMGMDEYLKIYEKTYPSYEK